MDRQDDSEWMTRAQVAEYLGVTVRTVARYIDSGQLRAYKRGPRAIRILRPDVDALFHIMPSSQQSVDNH